MWRWCERMVWEMVVAVVVMSRSITFVSNGQLNVIRGQSIIQRPSRAHRVVYESEIGIQKFDHQLEWWSFEVGKWWRRVGVKSCSSGGPAGTCQGEV